jgi:hypothetical protein
VSRVLLTAVALEKKFEGVRPIRQVAGPSFENVFPDGEKAAYAYGADGCVSANMQF